MSALPALPRWGRFDDGKGCRLQAFPPPQGLYDGLHEHDACGVAFVATMTGDASHDIVAKAITALRNLEHRGAVGAEPDSGDGAGILFQVPDRSCAPSPASTSRGRPLRRRHRLPARRHRAGRQDPLAVEAIAAEESLRVLGWRDVPVDAASSAPRRGSVMPTFSQIFVTAGDGSTRWPWSGWPTASASVPSTRPTSTSRRCPPGPWPTRACSPPTSSTTSSPTWSTSGWESALAVVHSRFSTNTFPSWPLAHPFRFIAHNGEINTVMGNRNWMRARETLLASDLIPGDLERLFPVCTPGASDSAPFDEVLELLHLGGRSLPHSVLMMIPEAWENHDRDGRSPKDFYSFHSSLMEPWDGPACVVFTDGTQIGAVLDRNGLRPSRYWVTDDGFVVLASEVGRARPRPCQGGPQGPPSAGADVPRRHRGAPDHRGRGDQGPARDRARRTASGSTPV